MSTEAATILDEVEVDATAGKHVAHDDYEPSALEWVEKIPTHWKTERLKRIAAVQLSKVDKNTDDGEEPVRLCNYVDVYYREFIREDVDFMRASATKAEVAKFRLKPGDVLITKDSEAWDDIAVPACVRTEADDLLCGYPLAQIRPREGVSDVEFLCRAFEAHGVRDQFRVAANGVTRFGVGKDAIDNALIPFPPLSERRAIASFLDVETSKIDTLVKKRERLIELLQEKRTALISHAVTKGLNPAAPLKNSGVDWLGQIPAHWSAEKFKHRVWFQEGPGIMAADFHEVGVPLIRVGDLTTDQVQLKGTNFLDPDKVARKWAHFQVAKNDLLISCSATNGVVSRVGPDVVGAVPYAGIIRLQPIHDRAVSDFIKYVVVSQSFLDQVDSLKSGVAIQHYGPVHLRQVYTAFPPIDEQTEIARQSDTETSRYDALIAKVTYAIERLREYRTALISAAVTGKIDVRNHSAANNGKGANCD